MDFELMTKALQVIAAQNTVLIQAIYGKINYEEALAGILKSYIHVFGADEKEVAKMLQEYVDK